MIENHLGKLDFVKSIIEQAENSGLVDLNVLPDRLDITLKNKKIRIWLKEERIELTG
jgi:hypothetical protein